MRHSWLSILALSAPLLMIGIESAQAWGWDRRHQRSVRVYGYGPSYTYGPVYGYRATVPSTALRRTMLQRARRRSRDTVPDTQRNSGPAITARASRWARRAGGASRAVGGTDPETSTQDSTTRSPCLGAGF